MISTKIVKLDPLHPAQNYLREAADILRAGGLVIIPTETVYGIAANMFNKKALERLYEIKKRPKDKPFSLHIDNKERIEEFAADIPVSAYKLIDKFWPGPLTLILKAKEGAKIGTSLSSLDFARDDPERLKRAEGPLVTDGECSRTIGLRMPDDKIALSVIAQADIPVVCPSANISQEPAPINFEQAIKNLKGLVDFAIDAGATRLEAESSIVDLTVEPFSILRMGALKKEDIESTATKKVVLFVCTGNSCRSVMAEFLFKKILREKKRDDIKVLSAGIMITGGLRATEETKKVLIREGIDVQAHRSQTVTKGMIRYSDIILVMERLHEERILELAPEAKNRLFLLKEFAGPVKNTYINNLAKISNGVKINTGDLNIADPIGRPLEFYERTFMLIKEAIERISNII